MNTIANQREVYKMSNVTLIDREISRIMEDVYDISQAIEHIKGWFNDLSFEESKQELNRLDIEREACRAKIASLELERYHAIKLEANRYKCERVMSRSLQIIEASKAYVDDSRSEWLKIHSRKSAGPGRPITRIISSFNSLYKGVKRSLLGENVGLDDLITRFEDELSSIGDCEFNCISPRDCLQLLYSLSSHQQAMVNSLYDYIEVQNIYEEVVSKERKAYARISKECKIEP